MKKYEISLYKDDEVMDAIWFVCEALCEEDAIQQAEDMYPDCEILYIGEVIKW